VIAITEITATIIPDHACGDGALWNSKLARTESMPDMPKLSYGGRIARAHRIVKGAQFRTDVKLAVRELCEALIDVTEALLECESPQEEAKTPGPEKEDGEKKKR
jgi:hypothetical protein